MRLEWATLCSSVEIVGDSLTVSGLGLDGVPKGAEEPLDVTQPVLVCVRIDADSLGICMLDYTVSDPNGVELAHRAGELEWKPGTAPQLVEIERYYVPIEVRFTAVVAGVHMVELWTDPAARFTLPLLVAEFPS